MSFDCVVDANAGIKLLLLEPLSDRADALFAHLTDDPPARFYVPDLFFIECTDILWKYVRRFDYPLESAHQDVASLTGLPLRAVLTGELVDEALCQEVESLCGSMEDQEGLAFFRQVREGLEGAGSLNH